MNDPYDELLGHMWRTRSATTTLAEWVGADTLTLDRVESSTNYRLSDRDRDLLDPHPGVFYGYRRSGLLCVPAPSWEPVAAVNAVVLTSRLPAELVTQVLDESITLGRILASGGARREFMGATRGGRTDESGRPIGLRVEARFVLDGEAVALVREDVYDDVIKRARVGAVAR